MSDCASSVFVDAAWAAFANTSFFAAVICPRSAANGHLDSIVDRGSQNGFAQGFADMDDSIVWAIFGLAEAETDGPVGRIVVSDDNEVTHFRRDAGFRIVNRLFHMSCGRRRCGGLSAGSGKTGC